MSSFFDTHAFFNELKEAGFSEQQAEYHQVAKNDDH